MLADKKNFTPLAIADYISALPIAFTFYMGYNTLKEYNKFYFLGFAGLFASSLIADFLKRLPYLKKWESFTVRPEGANNWDLLSKNDYSDKINPPGFPSGHMTTVTFFSSYILFGSETNILEKMSLNGLIIITAWARYFKGVHNIPQILAGILLGLFIGVIFVKLN